MSVVCMKSSCKARSGLCQHEKVMLGLVVLLGAGAAGHYMLHWY